MECNFGASNSRSKAEAVGSGWSSGERKSWLWMFSLTSVQQGPGQGAEKHCPGGSESSRGGDKNQQIGRHKTAGGMDELGERTRAETHLG